MEANVSEESKLRELEEQIKSLQLENERLKLFAYTYILFIF
jgi:hypothetical protein